MPEQRGRSPETELMRRKERALALLKSFHAGPDENREMDILINGPRELAEAVRTDDGRPMFGRLPHFDRRDSIAARIPEELEFFGEAVPVRKFPGWKRKAHLEGLLLYEMKFGQPLSRLAKEMLGHYPPRGYAPGRKISIFGLSGAGKSTAIEVLRELPGLEDAVMIDNDTVRYNLFAKKFKEVDGAAGASVEDLRTLIHNRISGALYLTLEYITAMLKRHGYDVVISSVFPAEDSDLEIYVEHCKIDPRAAIKPGTSAYDDEAMDKMARTLFEFTAQRIPAQDNYDWDNAEIITYFRRMREVTLRVPEAIHRNFVRALGKSLLERRSIQTLRNPEESDPVRRQSVLR